MKAWNVLLVLAIWSLVFGMCGGGICNRVNAQYKESGMKTKTGEEQNCKTCRHDLPARCMVVENDWEKSEDVCDWIMNTEMECFCPGWEEK